MKHRGAVELAAGEPVGSVRCRLVESSCAGASSASSSLLSAWNTAAGLARGVALRPNDSRPGAARLGAAPSEKERPLSAICSVASFLLLACCQVLAASQQ